MKRKAKGSMTVEATLVLPIFLFAMLLTAWLARMAECQDAVEWAATRTVREASVLYGANPGKWGKTKVYYRAKLEKYLEKSGLPISLRKSSLIAEKDEIDLTADYRVVIPYGLLPDSLCRFRVRVHTRAFTGVENRGANTENESDREVYITETGRVYHETTTCTYLKLSISTLKYRDILPLRNENGGRYKACEKCCRSVEPEAGQTVWITNFGDRYHVSRSCSGLKRKIKKLKISEVGKRTPCSKCCKKSRRE